MPAAKPPEFRRRAIALARSGDQSIAKIAADLGIAESCLRRWLRQDDLDTGRRDDGLTSDERKELAELRRRNRTLEMEVEILKRSPTHLAHYPGCHHKGDDPDRSKWGEIRQGPSQAWDRLRNGDRVAADAGHRVGLRAFGRCLDCLAHGPW